MLYDLSFDSSAVKAKRNKGMKNAGHGLNCGCRYWCHASDSLTEPSGPAASQQAHIPISLRYEPKFSQDCHQAIPSHSHFFHLDSHWERYSKVRHMAALQLSLVLLCSRYCSNAFKREAMCPSGVHGSSHGWHFSSLCFSLLSLHICTRTHSFSFKLIALVETILSVLVW